MAPFADHLGMDAQEFSNWRPLFSGTASNVLLVEGCLDKQYFEFLQNTDGLPCDRLDPEIGIQDYGGKDSLKNTLLMQFILRRVEKAFITFDLDAQIELQSSLHRLNLKESVDYCAVGLRNDGRDCLEGLLPERVLAKVHGTNSNLVMQLSGKDRRKAKEQLKKLYLDEFTKHKDYTKEELKEFDKICKTINRKLGRKKVTLGHRMNTIGRCTPEA